MEKIDLSGSSLGEFVNSQMDLDVDDEDASDDSCVIGDYDETEESENKVNQSH